MAKTQHATTEELLETVFSVVRAAAVATQRRGKHISAATNPDAVTEELCCLDPCREVIWRTTEETGWEPPFKEDFSLEATIVRSRYQEMPGEDTASWK
jgi:hypothetical protein